MAIFKTHPSREFVMVRNALLSDENLSWKAKGILAYLLSRPPTWKANVSDIEARATDGNYAVRSGLDELEREGYIVRSWVRDDNGTFIGFQFDVYDERRPEDERTSPDDRRETEKPGCGKPTCGEPPFGEPTTSNTDSSKTDSSKTEGVADATHPQNDDDEGPQQTLPGIPKLREVEKKGGKRAMFLAVAHTCKVDLSVCPRKGAMIGRLSNAADRLLSAGIAPPDVKAFSAWWNKHDWRGRRGEPPTPEQIQEAWGKFNAWRKGRHASENYTRIRDPFTGEIREVET